MDENKRRLDWNPNEHYKDVAVAEAYDGKRFSSFAGRLFNWLEKRAIRRAFEDLPKSAKIVDVPCGTGRLAEVLLESGFYVTGVDISAAMLSVAERRLRRFGNRFSTRVSDAKTIGQQDNQFDAALCTRFLMHFPVEEQRNFVRHIAHASRGRVVIGQGLDTPIHRARRSLKQWVGRFQPPAAFPLSPTELKDILAAAGLREVRRYHLLPILSESVVIVADRVAA